ncbi:MAG: radical SAM protein [Clostridia bacterium]|nr:radical SAM protein [Clostridia bacterium]
MNDKIEIDYASVRNLPTLLALLREKEVPENEYWCYMEAYRGEKAREKGIPLRGLFELTPLCNLDCKMCYVHLNADQLNGGSVLSVTQWEEIMAQAHAMGMMNATLTGGECLTYPGFDEIYMFLRGLGIQTSIKTNGILLNKERIGFFQKYPPRSIDISLYGSSNEAYHQVTGYAAFDIVYENLLHLKNIDFPVRIAITPSKYTYDDIPNILDMAKSLGFFYVINATLIPPRKETGRELCDLECDEYIKMYKMLKGGDPSCIHPLDDSKLPEYGKNGNPSFGLSCGAGRSSFSVNWKGCLSACENLNSLRISLLEKPFSEAWEKIHKEALSYPLPMECNGCAYNKVCINCTACRSNRESPGHSNPALCERTRRFIKEGIYVL